MNTDAADRWLSLAEIARNLGVKPTSAYRWIARRRKPAHKPGKPWKFKVDEVDEWVRSGKAAEKE